MLNLRSCPKEQDPTWDTSLGFGTNLPGLIRSFAETGEDLHLHFDSAKRVAEAAVESAIARFQRSGSARRWDSTFFTTWSTPLIGTLSKVDRKKAEQINQDLQKKLCQTFQTEAAIDLACDQDRVLREQFSQVARSHLEEILLLIWKKFTNRDIWMKWKTRTTKLKQHDLCQKGKSGSSSDNIVTWDIRSLRSWLVHYDMPEQDGKLYGLFLRSYVVQRAKHDRYRFLPVQECYHAVCVLTSALALTWLAVEQFVFSPVRVMESEVFLVRICVNTQMRLSLSFLYQFSVLCQCERNLTGDVLPSASRKC